MKRLIVPALAILISVTSIVGAAETGTSGVVNINSATSEQLQLLPRVGPALAGRILDFRSANGDFEKVDELLAVKGIGDRSIETLRPYLSVSGETTLQEKVKSPRSSSKASDDQS